MKYTAPEAMTMLDALRKLLGGASNNTIKQYLKNGRIHLNGVVEKVATTAVPKGAEVSLVAERKGHHKRLPFKLHWEDEHLLVAIKAPGMLSSGEGITRKPTLHKLVDEYVKESSKGKKRAYVVHRLDKEVGGLILYAKSEKVRDLLKEHWTEYTKRYLALTEAAPPKAEGTVETHLAEFKQKMEVVPPNSMGAARAVSHYRYVRPEAKYHLIEVQLETGKKNQIRVHLAHIGCPIVGDRKYGADGGMERQVRLLSYHFSMRHPVTGVPLQWEIQPERPFLRPVTPRA